jgi:hypothetical protein
MTVWNLGPLGRFKISTVNDTKATPARASVSSPPPPYTAIDEMHTPQDVPMKHRAPPQAHSPRCAENQIRREQLRRYVVEIVALTFAVDFDKLNAAIYDGFIPEETTTILCDSERADLLAHSKMVRKFHGQLSRKETTSISREDEQALCSHIVAPGEWSDIGLGRYALDLIGWYGEHASHNTKPMWADTIPGHWPTYWVNHPLKFPEDHPVIFQSVQESMHSFKNVMETTAPNQKALDVLCAAWDDCRRRAGGERIHNKF